MFFSYNFVKEEGSSGSYGITFYQIRFCFDWLWFWLGISKIRVLTINNKKEFPYTNASQQIFVTAFFCQHSSCSGFFSLSIQRIRLGRCPINNKQTSISEDIKSMSPRWIWGCTFFSFSFLFLNKGKNPICHYRFSGPPFLFFNVSFFPSIFFIGPAVTAFSSSMLVGFFSLGEYADPKPQ